MAEHLELHLISEDVQDEALLSVLPANIRRRVSGENVITMKTISGVTAIVLVMNGTCD